MVYVACSISEFKVRTAECMQKHALVAFVLNQRTKVLEPRTAEELDAPLKWQDDLWLSREYPDLSLNLLPAQYGWMILSPPKVQNEEEKVISMLDFGAKTYWTDGSQWVTNVDLKKLVESCRRIYTKQTKTTTCQIEWPAHGKTTETKFRYTTGALELQALGWSFCTGRWHGRQKLRISSP